MKEKTISGAEIQLWFVGREKNFGPHQMEVAEDGYVGKLGEGGKFAIQAVVKKSAFVLGVSVDNAGNVTLKKDVASERPFTQTNGGHLWEQKVVVHQSRAGVACTWPNDNHLNLVEVESGGIVRYWEIALISRNGEFFFTTQCLYEAQCYRTNHNRFACPVFQKELFPAEKKEWPQMVKFLETILDCDALPPHSEYVPTPKPSAEDLGPNTGRVCWWSHSSGTGAIKTIVDGVEVEVKVHWRQVYREESRFAYLVPGELVNLGMLIEANREGTRKTDFTYEAVGVLPANTPF